MTAFPAARSDRVQLLALGLLLLEYGESVVLGRRRKIQNSLDILQYSRALNCYPPTVTIFEFLEWISTGRLQSATDHQFIVSISLFLRLVGLLIMRGLWHPDLHAIIMLQIRPACNDDICGFRSLPFRLTQPMSVMLAAAASSDLVNVYFNCHVLIF